MENEIKVYEEIIKRGWGGKERKHFCRTETLVTKIALEVGRKRRGRERYYSIFIMQLKQVFFFIYSFTSKEAVNGKQKKKKQEEKHAKLLLPKRKSDGDSRKIIQKQMEIYKVYTDVADDKRGRERSNTTLRKLLNEGGELRETGRRGCGRAVRGTSARRA